MPSLISTFLQVLPVFLLVGVGYGLGRIGLLRPRVAAVLSRLVFYVFLPPLMFLGIAETRLSESFEPDVILWSLAAVTVFSIVVFVTAGPFLAPAQRGVLTQGASRSNLAFVGLAILLSLYGEGILGKAAVFIAFQAFLINLLTVFFLLIPHYSLRDPANWKRIGLQLVLNPIVLGCASGMAFSASGWQLAPLWKTVLKDLAAPTLPLALLTVGATLKDSALRYRTGLVALAAFLKLGLLPGLVWFLLKLAQVPTPSLVMAVVLLGSPTAVTSYIMAREMQGDHALASSIILATTVLAPATMTVWIELLS